MKHNANCFFSSILHSVDTELDPELKEFCLKEYEKDPVGVIKSNYGGWQSTQYDLPIVLDKLYDILDKTIYQILKKKLQITGYWININKPDSYNRLHQHPESHYSGVYYIQVPENSGKIFFENPNMFKAFSEINNYTDQFMHDTSQYPYLELTVKEGLLLMFPAHLSHGVDKNKSKEDRISISFNARVIG